MSMTGDDALLMPTGPPPAYDGNSAEHESAKDTTGQPSAKRPLRVFPLDVPVLQQLKGKRIILASASPRRKQLLAQIGLTNLEIIPSTLPENRSKTALSPFEYVSQTSHQKCMSVYKDALRNTPESISDPALVISADTVIVTNTGQILEKPRSEADHFAMLKQLRDQRSHKVLTAVTILAPRDDARHPGYNAETTVEETKVVFDATLDNAFITAYVKTREGADKAGGYGIQGMGALLIERIEGSFDNVVGLPVRLVLRSVERCVLSQGDDDFGDSLDDEDAM